MSYNSLLTKGTIIILGREDMILLLYFFLTHRTDVENTSQINTFFMTKEQNKVLPLNPIQQVQSHQGKYGITIDSFQWRWCLSKNRIFAW